MRANSYLLLSMVASSCDGFTLPPGIDKSWVREAEKKHSRVAILAVPTLAGIYAATGGSDPIQWLNHQDAAAQISFYSVAGVLESVNLRRLGPGFRLRKGEEPGKVLPVKASVTWHALEDATGRIAMLTAAGIFVLSILTSLESVAP